ncbi:MAG: 5-formyltetrahydrofolate cyclo-ligase [Synechococcales cyanobacterium]
MIRTKAEWRQFFRQQRQPLSAEDLDSISQAIRQQLVGIPEWPQVSCILTYKAFRQEVNLDPLVAAFPEKIWGIPRCLPDQGLAWHHYHVQDALQPNRWGIPEPLPTAPPLDPIQADWILVPALGCDRWGTRIGYGQGFYDRVLPPLAATRVAVVPAGCLVDGPLPRDPWDAPVHRIVTEREIMVVEHGQRS